MASLRKAVKALILPAAVLAVWHFNSKAGILNGYIVPPPHKVLQAAVTLIEKGTLAEHVAASLVRVFWGFFWAFILAFPAAVLIGLVRPL